MKILAMKISCVSGCYLDSPVYKEAEVPGSFSLSDMCEFILDAFDFDNDHLHNFFISSGAGFGQRKVINDETLSIEQCCPSKKSQALFMNFDFGDDWLFKIELQPRKVKFDADVCYPRITCQKGENPEQYPMCEDYE